MLAALMSNRNMHMLVVAISPISVARGLYALAANLMRRSSFGELAVALIFAP
jgi:hypothetical protein